MKLPNPIKKVAVKVISFVLRVPFLKKAAKRLLPKESRLYQKLYHGYHKTIAANAPGIPTSELENALKAASLEQMQIFQKLLSHGDVLSEGVYDENCY